MPCRRFPVALLVSIVLTACQAGSLPVTPTHISLAPLQRISSPSALPTASSTSTSRPAPTPTASPEPPPDPAPSGDEEPAPSKDGEPTVQATPLPEGLGLDPAEWHDWPVVSVVPENARLIFLRGQELGNDPHAFSVFGDCQQEPDVFMGVYETDPDLYSALPVDLQETVDWFRGSFNRLSPTVRPGTTTGALLWSLWHRNRFTCTSYETPLQCELRIHQPAFVIIQVGSHYESRNQDYMAMILEDLIAAGVVPILSTKADNREHDEHVNAEYAQLALEYQIPFWNFWGAVKDLPNRGLYTRDDASYQGDLYLTDEAVVIHRLTALQALDAVRRAVMGGQ